ncbi:MAG: PLxRFG domain-containing protein, partial [Desulfosalsimonas sp.]
KPAEVGAPAYQIIAFHGTPHDVMQSPEGRFSTRYMGRGEGAHAFGWGLYFTDVGQVAKYYAQQSTEKGSRNLYQVSLHKGKDPSEYTWLDWYQPVPDEVTNKIADYIQKKGQADFAESFKKAVKQNNLDGRELYRELAEFRGSEKDASLFLLDAGIDGIRYPSGTLSGVKVGEGNNYVVFDENAVTIEDHIQYSRRGPQTESEKNAAAMQQEQRLVNAGMDRFRKFLNEMVDDRKGAINAGKWMKETGTHPPTMDRKDFPKYISSILTPYNFAQRDEQFRKLFEAEQNSKAFSHYLTAEDRISTESYYDLKDKSKVNRALIAGDKAGVEYKDSTLKTRFGLNEDEIAAFRGVRQALDDKLRRIIAGSISDELMEQTGLGKEALADLAIKAASKEDLQNQLEKMGVDEDELNKMSWLFDWVKQHAGYIPHKWKSEWRVRVVADGETWMLDVPTVGGKVYPTRAGRQKAAQQNAIQVAKKRLGWDNNRIQQAIENTQQMNDLRKRRDNLNKRLDAEKNAKARKQIQGKIQEAKDQMEELEKQDQFLVIHHRDLPVDLFQDVDQGLVKNLAEAATEAAWQDLEGDFSDKEYAGRLKTAIRENVEKMYLAKGGLAHLIGRKGVKGYREDIENVLAEYLTGANSLIAKHEKARNFANAFKDISPRTPEKWRYSKQYIEDMLGETHEAGWFKRVAGTWFLAADISAAALNFTQNYTHGVSSMRRIKPKRDKITAEREIHGAMRDVVKEYFDAKRKGRDMYRQATNWLTKDEVDAVRSAMDRGILDPAFLGEVTGFHRNAILDTRVIQEGLFKTFTGMEAMNRMSTFLAAYRRAKKARTGTEAEIEAGALEDALKIVDSSHFVYGRGNRPELIRKTGALGNVAFTFMTYPVNNLIWLKLNTQQTLEDYHKGDKEAVKRDMQVIGSNLGYLFAFGGMGAMPFIYLAQAAINLFDDDNEDWETLMRRHTPKPVGRLVSKGLPAMLGNDFSFRVQGTDVFGAPIGFQIAGQLKRRAQTAAERWGQYEYGGAIFHLMPDFIRNPYRAYLGYTEGGEREGAPPIKYGAGEAAWRALGFSPTRESETYEATGAARKQYYRRLDKLENYAERYIAYQHNPAEINRLRQEVRQYNIEQRKKGDRGLPIPWKDVISSAKQRRTTRHKGYTERLPKYMEDYQKEVHQDYGLQ